NRAVTLFVRVTDIGPDVNATTKLDGKDYASGTAISVDGSHALAITATNCAGLTATKSIQFTIDRIAPAVTNLVPANGVTIGTLPTTIVGLVNEPATVSIAGTGLAGTTDTSGHFTIANVLFHDGSNTFTLHAVDAAGNTADVSYEVTIRATTPE